MRPKTEGILESSLYVSDLARSIHFYENIFGFRVISDFGERGCALEAGTRQVLLLFKKGRFTRDHGPARWRRRATSRICDSRRGTAGMGSLARGKRNRGGREDGMEIGRPEPLLPRSRPASDRSRYAGSVVDLLMFEKRAGLRRRSSAALAHQYPLYRHRTHASLNTGSVHFWPGSFRYTHLPGVDSQFWQVLGCQEGSISSSAHVSNARFPSSGFMNPS